MSAPARDHDLDGLPGTLPIFPLAGVILLPRARLPLNIFEPRYLAMVEDAMASPDRLIGMIQPVDPSDRSRNPPVYRIGCAGRIEAFKETGDGRYLITLNGVCRFELREELEGRRGYRIVAPDWSRFAADRAEDADGGGPPAIDRPRLMKGLKAFFARRNIPADWDVMARTPDERLVNALAMICPFDPAERQALLEAPTLAERARLLIALVEMAVIAGEDGDNLVPQ